jgi:hypothetical protein
VTRPSRLRIDRAVIKMGRSVSPMACALCVFALIASCVPSTNAFAIEIAFNETECFSKQIETARDVDGSLNLPFRVLGAYVVSKDPHKYYEMQRGERNLAIVSVEVTQPDGQVIHRDKDGKSRNEFDVDAHGVGTYSICFTNAGTKGKKAWFQALPHQKKPHEVSAFVRVHYFQPVHEDDSDAQNAEIETLRQQSPKNTKGADAAVPRKTESTTKKGSKESASKVLSTAHASDINVLALNLQDEVSLMRQELFYLKARASRHKKTADSNARRTLWWTLAEVCTLCAVAGVQVSAVRYFFNKDERKGGNGGRGRARGGNAGVGTMYGGGPGGFGGGGRQGGGFGGQGGNSFTTHGSFGGAFAGNNGQGYANQGQQSYGNTHDSTGGAGQGYGMGNNQGQQYGHGAGGGGSSPGVLPPQAVPGQGHGSYAFSGGQAVGVGGGSVYTGNDGGLRGRPGYH